MKICLYLEFYNFLGGILFKKIGTGLLSSYENQKQNLNYLNIPFVEKYQKDCEILQINTPWLKSLYLIKKAKRHGKKIIIWAHVTAEDVVGVFRFTANFAPVIKKYLTFAYGLADIVFCPTEYTKSLLIAYGLPEKKLVVLSNGVDLGLIYKNLEKRDLYRKQFKLDRPAIGMVGLVIPRKGVSTFIELAKKFPDKQFIWFGKIYNRLLAEPLPENLPENSRFTGFVEDRLAAFNALDVFLFPSYEENEGMAILEAAAVGLPILVRDIPVYDGWLIHGENCLKAKNNQEFIENLIKITDDSILKEKLSLNARKIAYLKSKENLSKNLNQIYNNLINK